MFSILESLLIICWPSRVKGDMVPFGELTLGFDVPPFSPDERFSLYWADGDHPLEGIKFQLSFS